MFKALPFFAALFIPRTYTVSITETINKPQQEVFDFVKILDNQKKYSIWFMKDPNMDSSIEGKDGTIGAVQKWNRLPKSGHLKIIIFIKDYTRTACQPGLLFSLLRK